MATLRMDLDGDSRKHVSLSLQGSVLLFCFQRPQPYC